MAQWLECFDSGAAQAARMLGKVGAYNQFLEAQMLLLRKFGVRGQDVLEEHMHVHLMWVPINIF